MLDFVLLIGIFLPPSHLLIQGEAWKVNVVKQVEAGNGFDGQTHCERKLIEIQANGPEEMRDVTVHELMHALTCKDGKLHNEHWNNKHDGFHEGIYRMTPRLLAVIRDNPQLTEYLQR